MFGGAVLPYVRGDGVDTVGLRESPDRPCLKVARRTGFGAACLDCADIGADLLRLRLHLAPQLYPQISGHKTRYAIRFLPLDSENGVVPERLTFELACC